MHNEILVDSDLYLKRGKENDGKSNSRVDIEIRSFCLPVLFKFHLFIIPLDFDIS